MMLHSLNLPAGLEPKELGIIWVGPGGVDILLAPAMVKEGDQTLGTSIVVEDHGRSRRRRKRARAA